MTSAGGLGIFPQRGPGVKAKPPWSWKQSDIQRDTVVYCLSFTVFFQQACLWWLYRQLSARKNTKKRSVILLTDSRTWVWRLCLLVDTAVVSPVSSTFTAILIKSHLTNLRSNYQRSWSPTVLRQRWPTINLTYPIHIGNELACLWTQK